MRAFALTCPQCGGSQEVTDDLRFLECRYCRVQLRAERSEHGVLERLLLDVREENAELVSENRKLNIISGIHRLDRGWAARRPELLVSTNRGLREPSLALGWGAILFAAAAVALGLNTLLTIGADGYLGFGVIGLGAVAAVFGLWERSAAQRYLAAKSSYEQEREDLCDQLAEADRFIPERPLFEDTRMRRKRLESLPYPAADA